MTVALVGVAQSASIWEEFDFGDTDSKPKIDTGGVNNNETPVTMTAGTGFTWGGKSVEIWAHKSANLQSKSADANDYAYTIMDSAGGNSADTFIDLSNGIIMVRWWTSDNDDLTNVSATIQFMVRNGAGKWYLSDSTFTVNEAESKVESVLETGSETWTLLGNTDDMDEMDAGGEQILTLGDSGQSPDLSSVDGMGYYYTTDQVGDKQKTPVDWIDVNGVGPLCR